MCASLPSSIRLANLAALAIWNVKTTRTWPEELEADLWRARRLEAVGCRGIEGVHTGARVASNDFDLYKV
jgi:hypothetical protein